MYRRSFLKGGSAAMLVGMPGLLPAQDWRLPKSTVSQLDAYLLQQMSAQHIPGVSACLIRDDRVAWQGSYGYADLEKRIPLTADHIQNIASISKTYTALAAMMEVEAGRLSLDADVNDYLPWSLRNPNHPGQSITPRMLMHHTSTLLDGPAYGPNYACGDPRMPLGEWIESIFKPGGGHYDADGNFAAWAPGARYSYSNTAFGLLGYLVERSSGVNFHEYCQQRIFKPLGMANTGWLLADVDMSTHLATYTWFEDGEGGTVIRPKQDPPPEPLANGFQANCAYNHPNYPDGFLRTSMNQMVTWARFWLNNGEANGNRLLKPETVREMFTDQNVGTEVPRTGRGLTWGYYGKLDDKPYWGHGGGDPGVSTILVMQREEKLAAIILCNSDYVDVRKMAIEIVKNA